MAWGTNKFLKKLVKPNAISNNELADFISRVPDNEELVSTIQCCVINKTESIIHSINLYLFVTISQILSFVFGTIFFAERHSRTSFARGCCESKASVKKEARYGCRNHLT